MRDIKQLRNYYRHDLEHGKPTEIIKKQKRVEEIFRSLIEKPLPENELDFRNAQMSILERVMQMLNLLYNKISLKAEGEDEKDR